VKFYRRYKLSVDEKELIKLWKSSACGSESRIFQRCFHIEDVAFQSLAHRSGETDRVFLKTSSEMYLGIKKSLYILEVVRFRPGGGRRSPSAYLFFFQCDSTRALRVSFVLDHSTPETRERYVTLNGSIDAKWCKNVPFGDFVQKFSPTTLLKFRNIALRKSDRHE